jgi:hypothetical protein
MTELEVYDPPQNGLAVPSAAITERDVVDGWVQVVTKVAKLADMIADTDFVPKALRNKPAAITACMLTGREIGVGPMLSMKVIHMVNGTPSLAAEYKRARAFDRGHEIVYEETSITRCVVRGRRRGERTWATVTWTIEDARRAKLAAKDVWQQNPRRMLEARATGELCDLKFPDCSWGLATTEALQDGDTGEHADAPAGQAAIEAPAAGPAQRSARRRQAAEKPAEPTPTPARPAPGSEPTAGPATGPTAPSGLPPLPGEDEPDPTGSREESSSAGQDRRPQETSPPSPSSPAGSAAGHASSGQVGIIHQHFKRLGFGDGERADRLVATAVIAGTEGDLASSSDLTPGQAKAVIDTLARCKDRGRLIALLATQDRPDDDG